MDTSISFWSIEDGLDPDTAFKRSPIEVNKDQFLATTVMIVSGKQYSIKDIILNAANISGAIHAGKPENQKEELLKKTSEEYSIGGYRANLRVLQAISRVALKALSELEEKVKQ